MNARKAKQAAGSSETPIGSLGHSSARVLGDEFWIDAQPVGVNEAVSQPRNTEEFANELASDHPEVFSQQLEENPAPVKATAIEVKNHEKRAA